MTHDDLVERFALHLLGALDGDEARAMAARAAAPSPEDAAALRAATELVANLGRATAPVAPPAGARAALLRRARAARPDGAPAADGPGSGGPASGGPVLDSRRAPGAATPAGRPSKWGLVGLAGLFLLLAGLQIVSVLTKNATIHQQDDVFGPLTDPEVERWVLGSTDPANPRPVAVAFHDTAHRRILVRGSKLPSLEAGQVYVLWALDRGDDGKTPRNLTAFRGGQPVIDAVVSDAVAPSSLKALAISIERDPTTTAPTRVVAAGGAP